MCGYNITLEALQRISKDYINKYSSNNKFKLGVYWCYPKPLEYSSLTIPEFEEDKLIGCIIKLNYELNGKTFQLLLEFFHELYHAIQFAKLFGCKREELIKAKKSIFKRWLEEQKANWFAVKETLKFLISKPNKYGVAGI